MVKSASMQISEEEIKKERNRRGSPEGRVDKGGRPVKLCRDAESDWHSKKTSPVMV